MGGGGEKLLFFRRFFFFFGLRNVGSQFSDLFSQVQLVCNAEHLHLNLSQTALASSEEENDPKITSAKMTDIIKHSRASAG